MDGSLLHSVFVFLAAACILVPISKLSGLGSVIGYLIAGVIIGPFALGLISEPETILHFSEFGVVMMLFLIGLELQPAHLWEMRGKLLGLGGLQVSLTTFAVTSAALLLGRPMGEAIVIGMALSLSSTAIALQIMQDRKIMSTGTGRSGFSVLLFQDVIVIAMIAALPFLAAMGGGHAVPGGHESTTHGPEGLWRALSIFAVFAGMILAGRFILRPVFRLIAKSQVRETFTAIALLLVTGAALLMEWLGLSAALGAFIAGVVLAESQYRHQLERDIEPFKALLLGLFFISVGMSLDFGALAKNPGAILGLVAGLMALKFTILFIIGTLFRQELSSRLLFSTLLCQAGEFGFVLLSFALSEGALQPELATLLNAVIAISMALTPIFVLAYDKFLLPRFGGANKKTGQAPENNHHKVLILGFGRVGQVATRLLHTQNIETTIIDLDGEQIELASQFGYRVFYGDAVDIDLLRLAGAQDARVIIIAIDDTEKATEAAHEIMLHFPEAKVIARARNRGHLYDLLAEQVDFAERETVRGALAMGQKALEFLDYTPLRAKRLADDFLAFDFKMAQEAFEMRGDMNALAAHAQTAKERLMETLNADAEEYGISVDPEDGGQKDGQ